MNTPIDTIIAGEQAKIDLLRAKIRECEHRIATLRAMLLDDDIDAVLTRRLHGPATVTTLAVVATSSPDGALSGATPDHDAGTVKLAAKPKKALNEATLRLLRFANGAEKSIDDFLTYARQNGIEKDRPGMRAFLHQYKSSYGLLNSARAGHFSLSEDGIDYLKSIDTPEGGTASAEYGGK